MKAFIAGLIMIILLTACNGAPSGPEANNPITIPGHVSPIPSPLEGKRIAIVVSMLHWNQEIFQDLYNGINDNSSVEISVLSPTPFFMGLEDGNGQEIQVEFIGDVNPVNFDAIIITGGEEGDDSLMDFIQAYYQLDKIIASVAQGTTLLSKTGLLEGVKVASSNNVELAELGVEVVMDRVFIDGKFITAATRSEGMLVNILLPVLTGSQKYHEHKPQP